LRADSYFAEGHGKGPDLDEEEENEKYTEKKKKNECGEGIKEHGSLRASPMQSLKKQSLLQLFKISIGDADQ